MPQSQRLSSVVPFVAIERPACPKCKAQMMLVSIEPARARGVDLHKFECAVCNQVLTSFAAFEDPMKSVRQTGSRSCGIHPAYGVNAKACSSQWYLRTHTI